MNSFQLYVILKLDDLHKLANSNFVGFVACMSVLATLAFWAASKFARDGKPHEAFNGPARVSRVICLLLIGLGVLVPVFVPTTKQAAVIWAVPQILESRAVQKDLPELYNLAVDWAKNQLTPAAAPKQ